ncbi:MAG: PKD domain-containing protein [Acidobacteria bacterium]|nr:PKD domain-containing protein [Acidobacteriota bacterium]MBV9475030.1 PKD domain-containing protein [Acidobacteriota bacterium]
MTRFRFALFLALGLFLAACNKDGNPVALPTDPGGNAQQVTLTLTTNVSQVETGATSATMLRVSAVKGDGTAPADGTEAKLNTSLGNFGVDSGGKPIQLTTVTLTGGTAQVAFFPGATAGVANILASIGTNVATLNLPIVTPPPVPVADFTFAQTGLSVLFADASTGNPTHYRWQFGDGTESTERNPQHVYATAGTYIVTLTAGNSAGDSNKSQFVPVSLGTPPKAAFTFEVQGSEVHFVNRSTGGATSWTWNFGDGVQSGDRDPVHTYAHSGAYTVVLTATNDAGSDHASDVVTVAGGTPPVAKFNSQVSGKQVNFIDQSTGTPTAWHWDFGDNTTSTEENPVHTYASAGNYTVVLTVSNDAGSDHANGVVAIAADQPPVAAFTATPNGHQVNFVDQSTGNPTSWSWSFGDGGASTQRNPIHTYAAAGNYTVTLTVANDGGSAQASKVVTIAAGDPPKAAFEFVVNNKQVNFVDRSTNHPTSYLWTFGDHTSSSAQSPIHTYAASGTYTVTLDVSNDAGSDSISQAVTIP